jgi:hypothetical protein
LANCTEERTVEYVRGLIDRIAEPWGLSTFPI